MSKYYKPTIYNSKGLQNQWINCIFQSHDIICSCNKPIEHLTDLINNQKCQHSTEETTTEETGGDTLKEETGFDEGDLEKLFENTQEDEG